MDPKFQDRVKQELLRLLADMEAARQPANDRLYRAVNLAVRETMSEAAPRMSKEVL